jgi:hypothetical protein
MLGIRRVAGNLQTIYTAGMEKWGVSQIWDESAIIVVNVARRNTTCTG